MCMHLRSKFQVSSIILTSFRQGVILHLSPPPHPPTHLKTNPEKLTQIRIKKQTTKNVPEQPLNWLGKQKK